MLKHIIIAAASAAILAGSLACVEAAPASSTGARHRHVHRSLVQPVSDITSFSSSSAPLHLGVNHPPKR